jgi:hypothetical protein
MRRLVRYHPANSNSAEEVRWVNICFIFLHIFCLEIYFAQMNVCTFSSKLSVIVVRIQPKLECVKGF